MKKLFLALVFLIFGLFLFPCFPSDIQSIEQVNVFIDNPYARGSGILVTNSTNLYVLSAYHVLEDMIVLHSIDYIKVVKEIKNDNDECVGQSVSFADILSYSDYKKGNDICLLKVRMGRDFDTNGATFYDKDFKSIKLGSKTIICGNFGGEVGFGSLSFGSLVKRNNKEEDGKFFDVLDSLIFKGASGCGAYNQDYELIGMVQRTDEGRRAHILNIDKIKGFLKRVNAEFLYNPDTTNHLDILLVDPLTSVK